ncbi:winged helix-turn-helix domain-containing protein [Citrobacter freundii]|uniref:winged helix-turn-helix domain-containing protein n=1 Tax=Citrobacter freundii TaxID=546 RepID=UPI001B35A49F|nr:winged helix-turn-helix domain-containing protein [Citrobacter freundii]EKU4667394.1 winged helix-turn-helix transcriptional regulator [Citrobacter freundii]MBQ0241544.1 winged helix-turn-helix transcriptional regulator [Citrobacter freundii]
MAKNNFIDGEVYKYASIEEALLSATRITNLKTGESVKLIGNDKLSYMILRKRFHLFTDQSTDNKYYTTGKHYDTIESIAEAIGVSDVGTVSSAIGRMEAAGLLTKKRFGKTYEWTVVDLTPELFLLERNTGTAKKPVWVDCLKHPVFGNAKESAPAVQPEEQSDDPMCDLDEAPEEEAPAPEKVKPAPKPKPTKKPAARKAPSKQQTVSPFEFKTPRDENRDWWYLERYNDADQFTGFNDFDLPYLATFESQGKLINQHSIQYLKTKRGAYERSQQT